MEQTAWAALTGFSSALGVLRVSHSERHQRRPSIITEEQLEQQDVCSTRVREKRERINNEILLIYATVRPLRISSCLKYLSIATIY